MAGERDKPIEIDLEDFLADPLLAAHVVDHLTYCCYRYNRDMAPEITVGSWRAIFGGRVDEMERLYQIQKGRMRNMVRSSK